MSCFQWVRVVNGEVVRLTVVVVPSKVTSNQEPKPLI